MRKGKEIKFIDGPQAWSRHYLEPKDGLGQTLHIHLEEYGPGGKAQKHGHVNEAAFYILDGVGYEIHDGIRYDWKAGDVAIVHNNCVHQHFNADPNKPARPSTGSSCRRRSPASRAWGLPAARPTPTPRCCSTISC